MGVLPRNHCRVSVTPVRFHETVGTVSVVPTFPEPESCGTDAAVGASPRLPVTGLLTATAVARPVEVPV